MVFALVMVGFVFVSSVSQTLLKKAASRSYGSRIQEYLNPLVISAYVLFMLSLLVNVYILKFIPLSLSPILESSGYVFVAGLSYFFLKERLSKRQLIGMGLIIIGIIIFSI